MAQMVTFLGHSRNECAMASVAMARNLAQQGFRTLWVTRDCGPLPAVLWSMAVSEEAQAVAPNLWAMHLSSIGMLAQNWEIVKAIEAQYLRDPLLKQVYGPELVILPGMDEALALNALRELDASGSYDRIVVDGGDGQSTLRLWGLPDGLDWYLRRFQQVVQASELARVLSPFVQPLAGAVLTMGGNQDAFAQPLQQARSFLAAGRAAVQDPQRVLAFLVTTANPLRALDAGYLWGGAQQIGLTVGAVLTFDGQEETLQDTFDPLPLYPVPSFVGDDWSALVAAMPDVQQVAQQSPRAMTVDEASRQVRLFLPGFKKEQITLTQSGPDVTIEAGNQRRNLFLPAALRDRPIKGAKFQERYLILSF